MKWAFQKLSYRSVHRMLRVVLPLIKVPEPELISGPGSVAQLPKIIKADGVKKVLVVTDKGLTGIGLEKALLQGLAGEGIEFAVFDDVQPNPSIKNIEDARQAYLDNRCEGLIGLGGGSPMDCAKICGARVTNPKVPVKSMKQGYRIRKDLPPLYAIPTTAGTGSETTIAAAITNPENHEKLPIGSTKLVPRYAVLDAELMVGLPTHITSTTGMDALTHAVEAYIGRVGTDFTNERAERAVKLIFENLEDVYQDGSSLEKRQNMALASFYAGESFTRALVGYVHAIAHNLGGFYGVPHGLANAVILPYILEFSRADITGKLARLAVVGGIGKEGEAEDLLADRFIEKVKSMNEKMAIPTSIRELKESDIPLLAQRAVKEGNPIYPVPTLMNREQCEAVLRNLLP